ncbi:hypothetical protein OQA88_1544 [Cercophora sp. LCS_1]
MSYSAQRPRGREHIPLFPKGWIAIRIVQLVLAVLVLGLSAYGIAMFPTSGNVYILVVGIMTLITSAYHIICEYAAPKLYNYWAVLGLDIFLVIMWLASFALLASEVSILYYYLHGFDSYLYRGYVDYSSSVPACLAVAAALGGVEFVLHIASLAVHGVRLHRHRAAGLHCTPGAPRTFPTSNVTTTATSMPGVEKNHPQHYAQPFPPTQPLAPFPPTQPLAPFPPTQPLAPFPPTQPLAPYPPTQPLQPYPATQPLQPYPPTQPLNYYPQQQQQALAPQQYPGYAPQQGQVPIPINSTGGSYPLAQQLPQQYYQQGAAVPLFSQNTGGSTPAQSPQDQVQQQQQQQQQQPLPTQLQQPKEVEQPSSTELPASQVQPQQQQ